MAENFFLTENKRGMYVSNNKEGDLMQGTVMNRDEETRQVAYRLCQEEGCPDGYDVQHWLKAETIWLEEHRPQNEPKKSKSLKGNKEKQTRALKQEP